MKIGLLGGTFNPIHMGHLVLARECLNRLSLDKVIFVPAHIPPHKDVAGDISVRDRVNIVRLALEGYECFEVSGYEIDAGGTSYSIDTIRYFLEIYGKDTELFFLTGADSAKDLFAWKDVDEVLSLVTFVIATRPGWEENSSYEDRVRRVSIPAIDISSTVIREKIRKRESIDQMLPSSVEKYIRKKELYYY